MPRKRKLDEEISVKKIYHHFLSNELADNLCDELYAAFQEKGSYKYLKNIGLHQISPAAEWTDASCEDVLKNARMHYDKIKEVTSKIEEEMEQIIREKFQGAFRNTLKEEILKFLNKPHSAECKNEEMSRSVSIKPLKVESVTVTNENKPNSTGTKNGGKPSLAIKQGDNMSTSVEPKNGRNSARVTVKPLTVENVTLKEDESKCTVSKKLVTNNEFDDASLSSLSSVHTSDLSSFDDAISISSDEETGRERKMVSWQFAQEEVDRCQANKVSNSQDIENQNKAKNLLSEDEIKTEDPISDGERISPRRVRKPNSKYFSSDIMSPFEVDLEAASVRTPLKNGSGAVPPRKRGRPRKYAAP